MSLPKSLARRLVPANWLRRRPRQPMRSQPRRRLAVEPLEDRIAPATDMLDVAGLRYLAPDGFTLNGSVYSADKVSIGYTPVGTEDFRPLIQVRETTGGFSRAFELHPNEAQPYFALIEDVAIDLVAVGGSPSVPLPIWQRPGHPAPRDGVIFDIGKLQSTGVMLDPFWGESQPVEVAFVDFSLTSLRFNNPDEGTTADSEVWMQGFVNFSRVPLLKDAPIQANVGGPSDRTNNYVIANHSGITLTGLDVTVTIDRDWELGGFDVIGKIDIGYSRHDDSFSLAGTVQVTSQSQGSGNAALNQVSAGLALTVTTGAVVELGFDLAGSFRIFDLNVSTIQGNPLKFQYQLTNAQQHNFEVSGGLQLEFNGNKLSAGLR